MRLVDVRRKRCRSQAEIARHMGVSQQRVARIEKTPLLNLTPGVIARYLHALDASLSLSFTGGATQGVFDAGTRWESVFEVPPPKPGAEWHLAS